MEEPTLCVFSKVAGMKSNKQHYEFLEETKVKLSVINDAGENTVGAKREEQVSYMSGTNIVFKTIFSGIYVILNFILEVIDYALLYEIHNILTFLFSFKW